MAWTAPRTWTPGEVVTATELNTHLRDNLKAVVPVGVVLPFAGSTVPALFLFCDGAAVSRTTYATLFALLGTTYGVGDGTTTFNLPDTGGRVLVGHVASGGHADVSTLGANDGQALSARTPKHHHQYERADVTVNLGSSGGGNPFHQRTTVSTSGGGLQDAPSYLVLRYIIKALD